MAKKWIVINLMLLLIVALVGWRLHISVDKFNKENDLKRIQPVLDMKQKIVEDSVLPALNPPKHYTPDEFSIIPEKNIFSELRSSEEEETAVAMAEAPPLTQKPILVGIVIAGDQRLASVIDPLASRQGPGRRAQTKRVGDVFQGYMVTDINPEYIVLESGTRKEIIPLHEGSKQPQGGKTAILSTRIVSFGGGAISGGTPVVTVAGGPSVTRNTQVPARTTSTSAPAAGAPSTAQVVPVNVQSRDRSAPAQNRQAPGSTAQPPMAPNERIDDQGRRVIRTPFGDIIRQVPNP